MKQPRADVALVASSFLPRFGGVEEHVLNVARGLRRRGLRVVVWAVDQGDDVPAEVDGIAIRYLPCPLPARGVGAAVRVARRIPGAAFSWWRAVRRDRPRVVHVHCYGPNGPWADWIAAATRATFVVTSHGETFADANQVFDRSRFLAFSLRRSLRRAAGVTGPSRFTLLDLEQRFGLERGKGVVVPNGIALDEEGGARPPWLPEHYVLAVGRMVQVKGFDLLLDAFARLDLPGTSLVLAGDGPERTALRAQANELGMRDRVVLPGRVDRAQVVEAMRGAAVVAVPSRSESFGIVVLEAWRASAPVVATTRGGPPEFVVDGASGLLVDPEDTAALAAALGRLLRDDALARRLGAAGRRAVVGVTWSHVVDRYLELYARVGHRSGSGG
jgi:glycogen(starch) synthase